MTELRGGDELNVVVNMRIRKKLVLLMATCGFIGFAAVAALFAVRYHLRIFPPRTADAYLRAIASKHPVVSGDANLWGNIYEASLLFHPGTESDIRILSHAILDDAPPMNAMMKMNCWLVIERSEHESHRALFRDLVWQRIDDAELASLKELDASLFHGTALMPGLEQKSPEDRIRMLRAEKPVTGALIWHIVTHEELIR